MTKPLGSNDALVRDASQKTERVKMRLCEKIEKIPPTYVEGPPALPMGVFPNPPPTVLVSQQEIQYQVVDLRHTLVYIYIYTYRPIFLNFF